MKKKLKEWLSIQLVKNPGRMVLASILIFNLVFFFLSAGVISALSLQGTEQMSFIEAAFCTVTMILDAGCIQFVVADIGQSGVVISIVCLCVIIIGMISFTGAVIGYVTNYISHFIEHSNAGKRKLYISGHVVILNWNTRASEIVNDLLYCEERQKVVILVNSRKNEIEQEIEERLTDTINRENRYLQEQYGSLPFLKKQYMMFKNRFVKNITVVVREGDVFSAKQLHDISLEHAKSVIILGNDINNTFCKYEHRERLETNNRGNSQTVKTLMQVADITAAEYSDNNQKIIVEITDDWTWELVERIIACKQVDEKCNIVPVRVNKVLGQILSQFSLMPELNEAYQELFSNKGATFYSELQDYEDDVTYAKRYLSTHRYAIPLTFMTCKGESHCYYSAESEKLIHKQEQESDVDFKVNLNKNYWIERKNIVILGHNSKCKDIMLGFQAFANEWKQEGEEILRIIVIDNKENLEKMDYYKEYPFVINTVAADIYDKDRICTTIEEFVDSNEEDTSILILSDDSALNEDIDSVALANLVYVQDIINRRMADNPLFDPHSIDMVVEIIDPKHHDIVNSYNVNNVVISNRYISKMITQISEKEALFDFYTDILTYDMDVSSGYESKEIYVKKVSRFFNEIPSECTAEELIRGLLDASTDCRMPKKEQNPAIALGYVKQNGKVVLFSGNQTEIKVHLEQGDILIVFSNH
ncbi:MAG: hypothetical protein MR380_04990 [Lachnospiraceae bacterium]|nr:hypothetical protein [Lachnospiraceae bacterium]